MDDVPAGLAGRRKRDAEDMISKVQKQLTFLLTAIIVVFAISGCALKTYYTHLYSTPTYFAANTRTTTSTFVPTLTPSLVPIDKPLAQPTDTDTPAAPVCTQTTGTVQRVNVPSAELVDPLQISIYLPPCYDPSGNYPVLYLLHGQGMTDQLWIDLGVTTIADTAIAKGQTPFIMVFPYEEDNFQEITASKFPDAIINDLIPWVDSNYATCTERVCRAIGGISRGGGWAIKLALRHFDLFGTLGGHSYGLMYGDINWVPKDLQTHTIEEFPRIYLDRGEKDTLAHDIDLFVKVLQANGIHPEFHIYPGDHTKSYWKSHVQEYMNFYMAAWPAPFNQK
jgi:enterochelin esterase-like enzyme